MLLEGVFVQGSVINPVRLLIWKVASFLLNVTEEALFMLRVSD